MKNRQNKLEHFYFKIQAIEKKIDLAICRNEVDRVIELIDNRGRLIKIVEFILKEAKVESDGANEFVGKLYKNIQEFNREIFPKLEMLKKNIGQQIALNYKNRVSLRGYKSTSVKP